MTTDEIDALTIKQVRQIAERASEALNTLRELGLAAPMGGAGVGSAVPMRPGSAVASVAPGPFPCAACGRVATERPGEVTQPAECLTCGNHLPAVGGSVALRQSNKGPLVMDPEMLARRQALIATPAFDDAGEPT